VREERQGASTSMYRVQGTMRENYYGGEELPQKKTNLDAPRVTVGNKRMTNVQLTGGDVIQGIRRNNDLGYEGNPEVPYEAAINPACPLRYTPGLKCDPALEAMRPERHPKHKAITGGDKRKAAEPTMMMVEAPPMEAPGLMPMPAFSEQFMMAPPMQQMPYMGMAPYPQQDLLSQIKMRNRRFQQSCAMEGMQGSPMMRGPVMAPTPQMMMQPQMTEEMMMMGGMTDELAMIEQDLNMTRRATRPFIPVNDPSNFELQKQVQALETLPNTPTKPLRFNADEFLSVDQLPAPKKIVSKPEEVEAPKPAPRREVGIADQIAIRSYVLAKSVGKSSD